MWNERALKFADRRRTAEAIRIHLKPPNLLCNPLARRYVDKMADQSTPQKPILGGHAHTLTPSDGSSIKELVEMIAKALVDHPDGVQVHAVEGEQVTVLELRVHPEDLGKVIGRQGRTAASIRTILGAAGMKVKRRFTLEILE
jgi:uncharacterized protein